ncbi:MAG TPA: hypothetical protein VFI31_29410, partial [Pirellulales bacterium]|nr:hypothetical protein [Pirellulales bacterium]
PAVKRFLVCGVHWESLVAGLLIVLTLLSTAQAQARRGVRVRAPLGNDFLDQMIKSFTDPMLEREVPVEAIFIRHLCELSDDERAVVDAAGIEAINRIAERLRFSMRKKGLYVMEVDGRQVMLPGGSDEKLIKSRHEIVRRELQNVLKEKMPEVWTKLAADQARRDARRRRAAVLLQVAVLDDGLWLSESQRRDFCELLSKDANYARWEATSDGLLLDPATAQLFDALSVEPLGSFVPAESELAKLLTAAQLAIFHELQLPARQEIILAQRAARGEGRLAIAQRQARERAVAMAELRGNVQVVDRGPPDEDRERRLAQQLEMLIHYVDAACDLDAEQRQKLLLAGKLDIQRLAERPSSLSAIGAERGVVIHRLQIVGGQAARPPDVFNQLGSYFRKSLHGRLLEEQRRRLAAADDEGRAFKRQAIVTAAVVGFERRALLTADQCDALDATLNEHLTAFDRGNGIDWRIECVRVIALLAEEQLRPLFYDFHWSAAHEQQTKLAHAVEAFEASRANAGAPVPAVDAGIFWQVE